MSLVGITEIVKDMPNAEREEFCRSIMLELDAERHSVTTTLAYAAVAASIATLALLLIFLP
jgi:hypothetical protein